MPALPLSITALAAVGVVTVGAVYAVPAVETLYQTHEFNLKRQDVETAYGVDVRNAQNRLKAARDAAQVAYDDAMTAARANRDGLMEQLREEYPLAKGVRPKAAAPVAVRDSDANL